MTRLRALARRTAFSPILLALGLLAAAAGPAAAWQCSGPPPTGKTTVPAVRGEAEWKAHLKAANEQVLARPYRIYFLGDSLTERWSPDLWQQLADRGALNLGFGGDRTEHLLWRLTHGALAGPKPAVFVIWIGTNNIGHGHSVEMADDGIRAVIDTVHAAAPASKILLLGLPPRGELPTDALRQKVEQVDRDIRSCADGKTVTYADISDGLLDAKGRLLAPMSPDRLHFSHEGYQHLTANLEPVLDRVLATAPR